MNSLGPREDPALDRLGDLVKTASSRNYTSSVCAFLGTGALGVGALMYFPDGGHDALRIVGLCLIAIGIVLHLVGIGYRVAGSRASRESERLAQAHGLALDDLR